MRSSQTAMAEAVKHAILSEGNALAEAPTGTGKSIAYLVPSVLSGKTIVVSTANKSLQHQLYSKDIPFSSQGPVAAHSSGGCEGAQQLRLHAQVGEGATGAAEVSRLRSLEDEQAAYIRDWLDTTETGDVDDLPFMLSNDLRPRIVSFPDDCLHSDCRFSESACWINRMRDAAANAQVLITNHHSAAQCI